MALHSKSYVRCLSNKKCVGNQINLRWAGFTNIKKGHLEDKTCKNKYKNPCL